MLYKIMGSYISTTSILSTVTIEPVIAMKVVIVVTGTHISGFWEGWIRQAKEQFEIQGHLVL